MSEVHVDYRVTVTAVVDTDAGTVTEVHVNDESIALDGEPTPDTPEQRKAVEIAESADWPRWETGW